VETNILVGGWTQTHGVSCGLSRSVGPARGRYRLCPAHVSDSSLIAPGPGNLVPDLFIPVLPLPLPRRTSPIFSALDVRWIRR
jgi:hypothetical protein